MSVAGRGPRTRAEGRPLIILNDSTTGQDYITPLSPTGRPIEKNRSDHEYGYKSHLTEKQRAIIRWYFRQRDRGCSRKACWNKLIESAAWQPQPMQYPLSYGTLGGWELTRAAEAAKGHDWPSLSS